MKRKDYTRIIIYALLILVFNLVFFISGGIERSATCWVAYTFVHVALVVSCAAPFICINYKRIPENLVTIYVFAWIYSILGIILNAVYIFLNINSVKSCCILNIILLVAYIIQLLINVNVNYTVEKNIETIDAEREFIRDTSSKLKMLMQLAKTEDVRRKIEKAYDTVRTSPIHSNSNVMDYEVEVMRLVKNLEEELDHERYDKIDSIIDSIISNSKKRNAML